MKSALTLLCCLTGMATLTAKTLSYPIVHTGHTDFYNASQKISTPAKSSPLYRQDASLQSHKPLYKDNHDGTITDVVTGLMWEADMGPKMTFEEAEAKVKKLNTGRYSDWRIPSVKELYSLIQFTGQSKGEEAIRPYIDTNFFKQPFGDTENGEREIDAQTWSSTRVNSKGMRNETLVFGVNFVDGRIKGYPLYRRKTPNRLYFRMVRGNPNYGKNKFVDNGDGTISDLATGLMWQKSDSGKQYDWEQAFTYAASLKLAGHSDWRLPTIKELQSLVDYSRSPESTQSPALSPLFKTSLLTLNEMQDTPYVWSSTTHLDGPNPCIRAAYICFGRAWGKNPRTGELCDVHGAGAQRSDPKAGNAKDYPRYFGPQGDRICVFNAVRCVRTIASQATKPSTRTAPATSTSTSATPTASSVNNSNRKVMP